VTLLLYHASGSRSARILWLLDELGLDYAVREKPFAEWPGDEDLRRNAPLGRLPCLLAGTHAMIESLAIMEWLLETRDAEGRLWARPGEPDRAEFLQWLHFSETIGVHIQNLNQQTRVIRPPEARSPVTIKLETRRLDKTIALLEARLQSRDHVLDRGFTAADIALGWSVNAAFAYIEEAGFPRASAWIDRLKARPAAARALSERLPV
jgi:glutathione S-transferase